MWWQEVVEESTFEGLNTGLVQQRLTFGVLLFIVSNFLWHFMSFFLNSISPSIEIENIWPRKGIYTFNPWKIPFWNTLILLLYGCTVTSCHHALISNFWKLT